MLGCSARVLSVGVSLDVAVTWLLQRIMPNKPNELLSDIVSLACMPLPYILVYDQYIGYCDPWLLACKHGRTINHCSPCGMHSKGICEIGDPLGPFPCGLCMHYCVISIPLPRPVPQQFYTQCIIAQVKLRDIGWKGPFCLQSYVGTDGSDLHFSISKRQELWEMGLVNFHNALDT